MPADKEIKELKSKMDETVKAFQEELRHIQTGRANPAMIENIKINYYDNLTPLKHIANIATPDPNSLLVQPYDSSQVGAIEKGILEADLGMNPQIQDEVIRIQVPKLSKERRDKLIKMIKEKGEEAKVSLRNSRREVKEHLEEMEDDGTITEDDLYRYRDKIDEITHSYSEKIDDLVKAKKEKLHTI